MVLHSLRRCGTLRKSATEIGVEPTSDARYTRVAYSKSRTPPEALKIFFDETIDSRASTLVFVVGNRGVCAEHSVVEG